LALQDKKVNRYERAETAERGRAVYGGAGKLIELRGNQTRPESPKSLPKSKSAGKRAPRAKARKTKTGRPGGRTQNDRLRGRGAAFPSKQEIVAFLNEGEGTLTRRDIARAFAVKGDARAELRALLKEMEAEGSINLERGKRVLRAGALPAVLPIDVLDVDDDGDLECEPAGWGDDHDPPMIRIDAAHAAKQKPAPGVGDRLLARLSPAGDGGYAATIIKAIGKSAHRFLAVYRETRDGGRAEPVERRTRHTFRIEKGEARNAKDGDLVWIEAKAGRDYGPRTARVRAIEGHIDDRNAFSAIALASHDIPVEFPAAALADAEKAALPPLEGRVDLRDVPLVTIDPADARDHDDAVFAEPLGSDDNPGGWRIIVAIADVSFFVRPGDALDREALKRGNSVYLPDRVVPMLPERLSNDLCSLREGEDRPCLAVELIVDSGGNKKSHRFMRAMMRSGAKLSYEEAQAIRHGACAEPTLRTAIDNLFSAFRTRWTERSKRAPLDLDLPERKVMLDASGAVEKIVLRERFEAHRVIEELMILANVAAAETLERAHMERIYRVHDQPGEDDLKGLRDYLETLGYALAKGGAVRPANFNQILKIAEKRGDKVMISEAILRAQRQAIYDTENRGHFGLNLPRYAHFTSPIRRYADLTVHRALVAACKLGPGGQTKKEAQSLTGVAEQISDFERRAVQAEREAMDRYLSSYLEERVGEEFDARIRGVTKFGLFVMLDETGADGFIPMRTIGFERYRFEERAHRIVGEANGGAYSLGQAVRVRLREATPLTGGLLFELLSPPLEGEGKGKGGAKAGANKKRTKRRRK
jgi:ribonuclease R